MAEFNYEGFWSETLSRLRSELGEGEFGGWFTDIRYLRSGENSITLGFPSGFHRDKFKARYQNAVTSMLKELSGGDIGMEYEIITGGGAPDNAAENLPEVREKTGSAKSAGEGTVPEEAKKTGETAEKPKKKPHAQMRDDYTFEKYVVGENNSFAANAAKAISRNPGTNYNPFFIYGGVGLGKTHLMQAIGNYVYENSDNKVICITSEDFLNEYLDGISQGKMNSFKNKFRYTDLLLIDDIQFFQDKPQ